MIESIERLSIDIKKSKDKMLFRLDALEWVICVNASLADEIEKDFTGVTFLTQEAWRPY